MRKFNKQSTIAIFVLSLIVGFAVLFSLIFNNKIAVLAATTVNLGTADNFAILAGSGISDTNPSVISGDVGLSPTTGAAIGLTAAEVTGTIYAVDAFGPIGSTNNPGLLIIAKNDLNTAYSAATGQVTTNFVSADLGGQILAPGVYQDNGAPNSLSITGTLTLDGGGDPNAVFILKSGSTLVTGSNSHVNLINGAQACNVFWQVASSATLGTNSDFKGNILAFSSITDDGGSTVYGRLLARNAAVTVNNTNITKAVCLAPSTITVAKVIINDNGQSKVFSDFPLFVDSVSVVRGVATDFVPGTHVVSETTNSVYAQTFSGDCDATGHISIAPGDAKTCTITNNDLALSAPPIFSTPTPVPATLHVIKIVNNGNGGTAVASDFSLHVKNSNVDVSGSPAFGMTTPGTSYSLTAGTYVVSEDANIFYTRSFSGDCDANGNVTLLAGNNKTCTVTNTHIAATPPVVSPIVITPITAPLITAPTVIPKLPNTGLPLEKNNTPWNIIIVAGALGLVSASIITIIKKRTN